MSGRENVILDKSFQFALDTIDLYKFLKKEKEFILSKQLLRSGTSIGANVEEAIGASSKKDFKNKMNISLKEARESRYWLKLFQRSQIVNHNFDDHIDKSTELIKILSAIVKSSS